MGPKSILLTEVNKSKIKQQIRFCYICPNGKLINEQDVQECDATTAEKNYKS